MRAAEPNNKRTDFPKTMLHTFAAVTPPTKPQKGPIRERERIKNSPRTHVVHILLQYMGKSCGARPVAHTYTFGHIPETGPTAVQ